MITELPFNYSDKFVDVYIINYLAKATATLLNETQLRVIIEPLTSCINEIAAVFWEDELPFAIKLLDSLYNIALVKKINKIIVEDEECKQANKVYIDLYPSLVNSEKREVRRLTLYLNEIWQLCQGRLGTLKLDRIGEPCNWLTIENVFLRSEYRIKEGQRIILVKQIIQDFIKGAIDAAKAELELREQEAKAQLLASTVKTRRKYQTRLFSETESMSESLPTSTPISKNTTLQNEVAKPQVKRTRLTMSTKHR